MRERVQARVATAGAAALFGYGLARERFIRWGATDEERQAVLPGDELLANPSVSTTRALTIDAPPDAVWPWLVQMGQDRAGLYSYDWLENLFGLEFRNADTVVPEWQSPNICFRSIAKCTGSRSRSVIHSTGVGRPKRARSRTISRVRDTSSGSTTKTHVPPFGMGGCDASRRARQNAVSTIA